MIVKEVSKYEPAHFFFWLFIGQDLLTVCNMQSALAIMYNKLRKLENA